MMSKKTKELLHYPIVWSLIWLGIYLFMKFFPPKSYDFLYMVYVYLIGLIIFYILDKTIHKYYLKERWATKQRWLYGLV